MPKPAEPPRNPEQDTDFVQLSQIEPIRVVLDPSSPPVRSVVRTTIIVLLFLFIGMQLQKRCRSPCTLSTRATGGQYFAERSDASG